jgi:hypothetical protein
MLHSRTERTCATAMTCIQMGAGLSDARALPVGASHPREGLRRSLRSGRARRSVEFFFVGILASGNDKRWTARAGRSVLSYRWCDAGEEPRRPH